MKGEVFDAVVIRQKKPYRRLTGERISFEDNAVALLKDEKGNPKGTMIKGPVAREIFERWKEVAKIAQFVLWKKNFRHTGEPADKKENKENIVSMHPYISSINF